jgi:hypothetical protein
MTQITSFANGREEVLDLTSDGSVVSIDPAHDQVHRGQSFLTYDYKELPNGAVGDYIFKVPAMYPKQVHFVLQAENTLEALYQFYEGTTVSAYGVEMPSFNRNRNSSKVALMKLYVGPSITSVGTLLFQAKVGLDKSYGGTVRSEQEFVLKDNTNYLLRVTNQASGTNTINGISNWYEKDYLG